MTEERQFLATIDAQPEDRTIRLVYADWLEERGDARGELVRLEEEMRVVPIHSDRYWELKPRRNELRKLAKQAWLKRLKYGGIDYEPVFGDVPDGWKERWRLLREFTERWHEVPMEDVGGPIKNSLDKSAKIDPALLAALPHSLREWLALTRDLEHINKVLEWTSFGPGSNDGHDWSDSGSGIYFFNFDGHRQNFFVDKKYLRQPDPPVEYCSEDGDPSCSFPHVTTFAFQYVMSTWRDKKAYDKFAIRVKRTKTLTRELTSAFPVQSELDGIQIFERTNMIAILNQNPVFTANELDLQMWVRKPAFDDDIPLFVSNYFRSRESMGFSHFNPQ